MTTTLKPGGTFPTPYGVSVPVFEHPSNKEEFIFSAEATAICAGIFEKSERERFAEDAKAAGRVLVDRVSDYGGHFPLLRVPLPEKIDAVYPHIQNSGAKALGLDDKIEAFVTLAMDHFRWCDRAEALLGAISVNLDQPRPKPPRSIRAAMRRKVLDGVEDMAMTLALSLILTSALEHLAESEIGCIEAGALYALTEHAEWRRAGLTWLEPVRDTWFREWVSARPTYRAFAARCQKECKELPAWIAG